MPAALRMQPPVLSPLSPAALCRAVVSGVSGTPARHVLAGLLRGRYSAGNVLLTASGTHALQLALGSRPVVALPAYSCFDLATAAVGADARIALYDLDPDTLEPDLDSLELALRAGARLVVVAPLYGMPVMWSRLQDLAARHGARLIEDAAQAHGARWHGRPLGSIGDVSVLSFGRGKGWTGGGGGALLLRGDGVAAGSELSAQLAPHAGGSAVAWLKAAAQWALARPALYALPAGLPWLGLGETHYRSPDQPRSISETVAALVSATSDAAEVEAQQRWERAEALLGLVVDLVRTIQPVDGARPGYLRLPVRIGGGSAARVRQELRPLGIGAAYPHTLAELPAVRERLLRTDRWPGAETLVRELVTLPTHRFITRADQDRIRHGLQRLLATG